MRREHFRRVSQFTVLGAFFCVAFISDAHAQLLGLRAATDVRSPQVVVANAMLEGSRRYNIPVAWLHAVMQAESGGDADAVSDKGAVGLMQLMPKTYTELQAKLGLGPNPFEPRDNILAGAAYLSELYGRYGANGFLAAYNAGPGRYEAHLRGRPLPLETTDYVARLAPKLGFGDAPFASISPPSDAPRAPIFVTAVASTTSNEMVSKDKLDDAKQSGKAAPHPLFPAHSHDKIFASEMHSAGASNAREHVDPLHAADLFVARATSESSR
ncbi:lytic transglycosylase domain-containing protein (plasmid) [Methylocystis parvus]|uniref:Lytic transglycosylase domain-containing protein n=2 Tax=Methylocystis parvus TaxID=134 RepID=A0A6B8M4P0_9HYPH|nr:lytic transglycosylase domain-containing protein [Methylocystis parvus]